MLQGTRSIAHQLLSQVFISCSILILVRQSLGFCKFTGQGRDLISLVIFLLQYWRSPCSTTNTFDYFFFSFYFIYIFVYLFFLVYFIINGLLFHWKKTLIGTFSMLHYLILMNYLMNYLIIWKSIRCKKCNFVLVFDWLSYFFCCDTFIFDIAMLL